MRLCKCGCGQEVGEGKKFIYGHSFKGRKHSKKTLKKMREIKKGNKYRLGKPHSIKARKNMSDKRKGYITPVLVKQKISNTKKGKRFSSDHRRNIREASLRYLERIIGKKVTPRIGREETDILDGIEAKNGVVIERQFKINGYFVDGYCREFNVVYEVDEPHHLVNSKQARDLVRQQEIQQVLGCKFVRIKVD